MKISKFVARCMLSSPMVLLAACGGDESTLGGANTVSGQSSLTLNITDGPVDSAKAVVVEFTGVTIKAVGKDEVVIEFDEPKSIDLLSLQGSAFASLLDGVELEAGDYEWVRLHVNAQKDEILDSYIEFEDGTVKELDIPGGAESGLKIKIKLTLVEGETSEYTIDFDLRKSLHFSKGDQNAHLKPSLRMVNNKESGSIRGLISETLISESCGENVTGAIYVYEGNDVVPTDYSGLASDPIASSLVTVTEEGFQYELGFIKHGAYTLAYTCDAAIDTPDAVEAITFLSTANIKSNARQENKLDMNADWENYAKGFDGVRGGAGQGGDHADKGMSQEERDAMKAAWEALSDEEKAAKKAEWEANRAEKGDVGSHGSMTQEERDAKEAEWEAKKAEWEALSDEEKAAKQTEWESKRAEHGFVGAGMTKEDRDSKKSEWDALSEEEKAAKKAELEASRAAMEAEIAAKKAEWEALTEEEKAALKADREAGKSRKPTEVETEEDDTTTAS